MARIRTIKPEFWTDEKVVQLPFEVRLLFVGLWNFADDEGYLADEPDRIRLQVLPSDDVDIEAGIDLLVSAGLVERCQMQNGGTSLLIPHFCDHQKISHPTKSRFAPEVSGKLQIPLEVRRGLARKYGCAPGGTADVECYSCGQPGKIWWPNTSKGRPGYWVSFSGLEISHFQAESQGGSTTEDNLVLCCRSCNRSMHTKTPISRILRSIPENSGALRPEWKGREWKGKEKEEVRDSVAPMSPDGDSPPDLPSSSPKKQKSDPPPPPIPASIDSEEMRQLWEDYRTHRREIRKPMKPTHERRSLEMLAGWGMERALAALKHTLAMGWQGIREPDRETQTRNSGMPI